MPRCSRPFLKVLALKFRKGGYPKGCAGRIERTSLQNWRLQPRSCYLWHVPGGRPSQEPRQTDPGSDASRKFSLTIPEEMGWLGQTLPVTFTKKGFVCCCTKALRIVPAWDIPQWLQRARINFTRINYFDNTSELFQQKENKWSTKE